MTLISMAEMTSWECVDVQTYPGDGLFPGSGRMKGDECVFCFLSAKEFILTLSGSLFSERPDPAASACSRFLPCGTTLHPISPHHTTAGVPFHFSNLRFYLAAISWVFIWKLPVRVLDLIDFSNHDFRFPFHTLFNHLPTLVHSNAGLDFQL